MNISQAVKTASPGRCSYGRTIGTLVFLCLWGSSLAMAGTAISDKVIGHVQQRDLGSADWRDVKAGDPLVEGTEIVTDDNAEMEITTEQGHRLHVSPHSLIRLSTLQADKTKTYLAKGHVQSKVQPLKGKEQYAIQTPSAVCAVRGTEFVTGVDEKGTSVDVSKGTVGFKALGTGNEVAVHAGESASILRDGTLIPPHAPHAHGSGSGDSALARAARHEVALDMTRTQVMAAAAAEIRLAEYREGKSLIDAQGNRVRLEEYIVRPQPNQFKLVALDKRDQRLDYFFYEGTFNKNLPTDLSVPLKELSGTVGSTAPDYFLTSYEMGQSNTQDSVHDVGTGGHLVNITVNSNGDYVLTDPTNPSNTRTVTAAQLQTDGTYKVYDPLADSFSTVTASQLAIATKFGVYIPENDTFKDLAPGDTLWKTRFNDYTHQLDNVTKITYSASGANNVLATNLDANWTYAGGFVLPVTTVDPNNIDATITNYYGDGTFESYRTVLIDNLGNIAPQSAFAGIPTGAAYNNELLKWNYEQEITATEFQGRKIDLVVEPKIFIESGLIQ